MVTTNVHRSCFCGEFSGELLKSEIVPKVKRAPQIYRIQRMYRMVRVALLDTVVSRNWERLEEYVCTKDV